MITLPEPVIVEYDGILVVRDDLIPGGTKRRAIHVFFDDDHDEYIYAAPVYGHAQLALAYAAQDYDKRAVIFCAKRNEYHPLTQQAVDAGAMVVSVPMGFLSVVQARARAYCERSFFEASRRKLLPFGLDHPVFIAELANIARRLPIVPTEVWSIASSGVLTRALQLAWPDATFFGVQVGATPDAGRATVYRAPEAFDRPAKLPPPFPAAAQYEQKAWRFVKQYASPGALFWSVA